MGVGWEVNSTSPARQPSHLSHPTPPTHPPPPLPPQIPLPTRLPPTHPHPTHIPTPPLSHPITPPPIPLRFPSPLDSRGVWAVPYHLSLLHTAEEIADACDDSTKLYLTSEAALDAHSLALRDMQVVVQGELAKAGVRGVGGLWGDDPVAPPPPARYLDLHAFAEEARHAGATVLVSKGGGWVGGGGGYNVSRDSWRR